MKSNNEVHKQIGESNKERMQITTECLTNIKVLKLSSWVEKFASLIKQQRNVTANYLWHAYMNGNKMSILMDSLPNLVGAAVFIFYIASGN